jgi:hypothetical protein
MSVDRMWLRRNSRLVYAVASACFFLAIFVWVAATASVQAAAVATLPFLLIWSLALYLASRLRR